LLEKEWEEKTFESDGATERARASSVIQHGRDDHDRRSR
jgi:hypothetical protein